MDAPRQRARSAAEKEERRAHLLATARAALADDGAQPALALHALSLNELARRAGMAKANVYRYFESREAVLQALLWDEWAAAAAAVCAALPPAEAPRLAPSALAGVLTRALLSRPLLSALIAALPSVLEQNLSAASIAAFKRETLRSFRQVGAALHGACPALSVEQHALLLHDACAAVAGLYPFCHPAAPVAAVMADPELAPLKRDYAVDLERFVAALAAQAAAAPPATTAR